MASDASTNDIMDFLKDNMVTREEFESRMNLQKLDLIDAMDDKIGALKGDLIIMLRKEDRKVTALIDILKVKEILTEDEASSVMALEPFPR